MCAALTLSMDQKVEPVLSKVKCYKCGVAIYEVRSRLPVCVREDGWVGVGVLSCAWTHVRFRCGHPRAMAMSAELQAFVSPANTTGCTCVHVAGS